MAYKVSTKSGKVYRASTVDHLPGFLKMQCWDGEHRVPAGEITYIKSTEVDVWMNVLAPIILFVFVFVFIFLIII